MEKDRGTLSDLVASRLMIRLGAYVMANDLGEVLGQGTGFQFPALDGGRLRYPDVSFVRAGRFVDGVIPDGWTPFPPDLVVESVSPNDLADDVIAKGHMWLAAGARVAWIVFPHTRALMVIYPGPRYTMLDENEHVDGGDVVPGFRLRVGDILPPATARRVMSSQP